MCVLHIQINRSWIYPPWLKMEMGCWNFDVKRDGEMWTFDQIRYNQCSIECVAWDYIQEYEMWTTVPMLSSIDMYFLSRRKKELDLNSVGAAWVSVDKFKFLWFNSLSHKWQEDIEIGIDKRRSKEKDMQRNDPDLKEERGVVFQRRGKRNGCQIKASQSRWSPRSWGFGND